MRAISPIGNYSIQLFEAIPKRGMDSTGTIVEYSDNKPVLAQFGRLGLTEWEEIAAIETFDFSALPEGTNPLTRISVFDTEGLVAHMEDGPEKDAYHEKVEKRLEFLAGLFPSEFKIIPKPRSPKPWPSYDENSVEEIFELQAATGVDPQDIRLYEVENQDRPEVIEACEVIELALRNPDEYAARYGEDSRVLQPGETFQVTA
jgi:hypothetical protein